MSTLHAFRPAARENEAARPDALARYRLAPEAISVAQSSGGNVAVIAARRFWRSIAVAAETLRLWRERAHSRKSLASLDAHMLRDIGISPSQLWHESNKPFWRE